MCSFGGKEKLMEQKAKEGVSTVKATAEKGIEAVLAIVQYSGETSAK